MSATSLGMVQAGKGLVSRWNVAFLPGTDADPIYQAIQAPGLSAVCAKFVCDPSSQQSPAEFNKLKGIRVSVSRPSSWYVSNASFYLSGRVFVVLNATGDVFTFSPRYVASVGPLIGVVSGITWDSDNDVASIPGVTNGQVSVFLEMDQQQVAAHDPQSIVSVNLYNFDPLV
jgi:hypothetical protein